MSLKTKKNENQGEISFVDQIEKVMCFLIKFKQFNVSDNQEFKLIEVETNNSIQNIQLQSIILRFEEMKWNEMFVQWNWYFTTEIEYLMKFVLELLDSLWVDGDDTNVGVVIEDWGVEMGTFEDVAIGEFEEESEDVGVFENVNEGGCDCDKGEKKGGGGRGISKISTTSEYPLEFNPPPKNILFVDDVDASW